MMGECNFNELAIRDAATKKFVEGDFDGGDAILAKNADCLSDFTKLECLGNRFFYRKKFQDAVRCYEECIGLNPSHQISRYQYLVGIQLERQGNLVDAFKRYQEAIEIDSGFVDSFVALGGLLVKVKDYVGALRCYRDAFELDSKDSGNVYNLRAVLEELVSSGESKYQSQLNDIKALSDSVAYAEKGFRRQ